MQQKKFLDIFVEHEKRKSKIRQRLHEFKRKMTEKEMFAELCYCILAANTSAKMASRIMENVGDIIYTGTEEDIRKRLHDLRCRFYNRKSEYIFLARNVPLVKDREYLVKNIKGMGYKEASHFLRNTGKSDYAILDIHILRSLQEFGVIRHVPSLTRKQYIEIEKKMQKFSQKIGIPMDELDLLLWARRTGEVLK